MAQDEPFFAQRRPGWQLPSLNTEELQLQSFEPLENACRQACPQCGKSRALFCYDCLVPFTPTPSLQLPFQLHIVTHAAERLTKATGVHAAVLCRGQVHLQSLEELPQLDPTRSVVMFPSDDALLPDQLSVEELGHVIIIDSKWRKARELNDHPSLQGMKRVKLPGNPRSSFWRFHTAETTDEGVCTIEALHLLVKALADRLPQPASHWDNLLWYYAYQHKVVERAAANRVSKWPLLEQQGRQVQQQQKKRKKGTRQQSQQSQQDAQSQGLQHGGGGQVDQQQQQAQQLESAGGGCMPPAGATQAEQQGTTAAAPVGQDKQQQQQQHPKQCPLAGDAQQPVYS